MSRPVCLFTVHAATVAGRIVNMSSVLGNAKKLSQQWQDAVLNPDLTVEALTQIMSQFVE